LPPVSSGSLKTTGDKIAGATKKNRTGSVPRRLELNPMRLAQVGLEIERRAIWLSFQSVDSWSGPRPNFPYQKRQTTTATGDPRRERLRPSVQKKPLCGNRQGKNSELKLMQTSAPASTLSLRLTLLPPACCSRGQV
jgi:hypothetical protein